MSKTKKRVEMHRMILTEFPITTKVRFHYCDVESKQEGLRRAQKFMGPLTPIPLKGHGNLSAFVDQRGRKFVLFWGFYQLRLLTRMLKTLGSARLSRYFDCR